MYGKGRTGSRTLIKKRIIAVIVAVVLLLANSSVVTLASAYTAVVGASIPRVSFYYDDTALDVQYSTDINGTYTTVSGDFTLSSNITALYFKVLGSAYSDVLCDGSAITKDPNNIYTVNNIDENISITIGTVVNLDVSYGSIVIGGAGGSVGRKYTYSDSAGAKTGVHDAGNIYTITGTTGTSSDGGGNNVTLTGAGDFNLILSDVEIYTGTPGEAYIGQGVCAPVSTSNVTGSGSINITLVGENTLKNVSGSPSSSFAALEKTYTDSTLFINGNGTLNAIGGADSTGIGSSNNVVHVEKLGSKNITINNGTIVATTVGSQGAGIGSGDNCSAFNIVIYGGNITATGNNNAAAIGGSGSVNFVGSSGEVFIYGGIVNATSLGSGAGIGGGGSGDGYEAIGGEGEVYIYGGIINTNTIGGGGGGAEGGNATVNISGGIVTATGSIGGGNSTNANGGTADIDISGGTITAANISGGHGIGGIHAGGSLNVTGGSAKVDHVCSEVETTGLGAGLASYYVLVSNGATSVPNAKVTAIDFDPDLDGYGLTDVYTDDEGKLYLWLPSGRTVTSVTVTVAGSPATYSGSNIEQQSSSIEASASPIVLGTVLTGELSVAGANTWQWQRYTGIAWENISGATNSTYTVQASDLGKQILVIINGTYSLPVSVPAPASFTVTIPESIPAPTRCGSFTVKGDRFHFAPTQSISISCAGDFKLELFEETSKKIDYVLYTDSSRTLIVGSGDTIGTFSGSGSTTVTLYYSITGTPQYSGIYTDILTFTVTFNNP